MNTTLTPDDRDKVRREMNDALDACLADNPRMVGYLLVDITQDNRPGKAAGFVGRASPPEIMAALLSQALEIGKALGISPLLMIAALNFGADILNEDKEARQ